MQMAQVEPSRSCINALLLVFENAGRSKQVGCLSPCRECRSPPPLPKLIQVTSLQAFCSHNCSAQPHPSKQPRLICIAATMCAKLLVAFPLQ